MTIKSGLLLGLGIGIGTIVGMGIGEDEKFKLINKAKRKIIFALTGEEWKPKKPPIGPRYCNYSNIKEWERPLMFNNQDDAINFLKEIRKYVENYRSISVHTLYMMRKMVIDYTWDAYGWRKEDIDKADIIDGKICLPEPIIIEKI